MPEPDNEESDLIRQQIREARARVEILKAEEQAGRILDGRKEEAGQRVARAAQTQRHNELKEFGRSLASRAGLPAEWRAKVTLELENYITSERFPASLHADEARDYIRAKVESIVQAHGEAVRQAETARHESFNRAMAARRQEEDLAARKARVKELIDEGARWATIATIRWDPTERDDARQDVLDALRDDVRSDWTGERVRRLVDEVLDEREESDEQEEEEEDEEDGEEDDGEQQSRSRKT